MSDDPSLALQKAILDALRGQTDAGQSVFDTVKGDPYPRIVIGDGDSVPVNDEADFGCDYDPTEVFPEINVWSQATGFPEAKRIASQVRGILHNAMLTVEGFTMELPMRIRSLSPLRDPDGKTRRIRMLFETRLAAEGGSDA